MAELSTVAHVQERLFPAGTTADTTAVGRILEHAEALIRGACNRYDGWLNTSAHTETFSGIRVFDPIVLKYDPVTAITSVKVYTSSTSSTTISSTTYRINDDQSTLYFVPSAYSNINATYFQTALDVYDRQISSSVMDDLGVAYPYTEVVYTGGYSNQTAIPDDLEHIAIETCYMLYAQSRGTAGGEYPRMKPSEIMDEVTKMCIAGGYVRGLGIG